MADGIRLVDIRDTIVTDVEYLVSVCHISVSSAKVRMMWKEGKKVEVSDCFIRYLKILK